MLHTERRRVDVAFPRGSSYRQDVLCGQSERGLHGRERSARCNRSSDISLDANLFNYLFRKSHSSKQSPRPASRIFEMLCLQISLGSAQPSFLVNVCVTRGGCYIQSSKKINHDRVKLVLNVDRYKTTILTFVNRDQCLCYGERERGYNLCSLVNFDFASCPRQSRRIKFTRRYLDARTLGVYLIRRINPSLLDRLLKPSIVKRQLPIYSAHAATRAIDRRTAPSIAHAHQSSITIDPCDAKESFAL